MAQRAGRYESWRHGGYEISTDPARLDLDVIHGFCTRPIGVTGSRDGSPELQGLRRWALVTADAHELYARFGFGPLKHPRGHMVIERSPEEVWPSQAKGA